MEKVEAVAVSVCSHQNDGLPQSVISLPRPATRLSRGDVLHLVAFAETLPGKWGTKIGWTGTARAHANWLYFFRAGPALDASPAVAVRMTRKGYQVTAVDVVSWLAGVRHEALLFDKLNKAMTAISDITREAVDLECRTGRAWDCLVPDRVRSPESKIGVFRCEIGPRDLIKCAGCTLYPMK
jgi:hypothetical protein